MSEGEALGEGLYWMAEKFRWGYEAIEPNPTEALRFYRQAAGLGRSDAYIRIGEFYEQGHVVALDPTEAVKSYRQAFLAGNPYGHAAIAKLLARTESYDRAEPHWTAVFTAIARGSHTEFVADDPGSVIHAYIGAQLRHGLPVRFVAFIKRFRREVISYHEMAFEAELPERRSEQLGAIQEWLIEYIGLKDN